MGASPNTPFSIGANRYLLNVVRIPRSYGTLSAYEFRYDDPVVNWHLVMVYDLSAGSDTHHEQMEQMLRIC